MVLILLNPETRVASDRSCLLFMLINQEHGIIAVDSGCMIQGVPKLVRPPTLFDWSLMPSPVSSYQVQPRNINFLVSSHYWNLFSLKYSPVFRVYIGDPSEPEFSWFHGDANKSNRYHFPLPLLCPNNSLELTRYRY